jgi:putative glutamine amidotransferase
MTDPLVKPLIGVPACVKAINDSPFHAVGDKYLRAIVEAAEGIPIVIPAFGEIFDLPDLVDRLDGLLLTGSPSNVYPTYYDTEPHPKAEPHDRERDATTLPLIRHAIEAGLPLFAICRGIQELNVALGGTLHARVHELPERMDHRRPRHEDLDVQYGPKHEIMLTPGSEMARLAGAETITVNSLHAQAIDRLAAELVVEAVAPDGIIEAVSVKNATNFALGVQWHPEYKVLENPVSRRLFGAFGAAARARAQARREAPAGTPTGADKRRSA